MSLRVNLDTVKNADWQYQPTTSPHSASLLEKGANIKAVQELLGHSNLNTTQVYLSVTASHLEEAIQLLD